MWGSALEKKLLGRRVWFLQRLIGQRYFKWMNHGRKRVVEVRLR